MLSLILAAEAAETTNAGDDFMIAALVLAGVAMLITAIATIIVTPGREHHDDHH